MAQQNDARLASTHASDISKILHLSQILKNLLKDKTTPIFSVTIFSTRLRLRLVF